MNRRDVTQYIEEPVDKLERCWRDRQSTPWAGYYYLEVCLLDTDSG